MSERDSYPAGVPCWVEVCQSDLEAGMRFYGHVFDWDFVGPGPMPDGGKYFVARNNGRDIAGVCSLPPAAQPAWMTHISVVEVDESIEIARRNGGMLIEGPFDAAPAGKFAIVADPDGAVFGLWQAVDRQGAQLLNEPSAWAMSTLRTSNVSGATDFYGALFGWQAETFVEDEGAASLFRLPGYFGGEPEQPVPRDVVAVMDSLGADVTTQNVLPHWQVGFWIDDTDRAANIAIDHGGKVISGPESANGFRSAMLADPCGAMFSINQLQSR